MLYSVTGATGFVGNNLVRHLLNEGHQVRVAVRESSKLESLNGLDVEIITGDLGDPAFAERVVRGTDGLFHAAATIWFGKTRLQESMRINVHATRTLADRCGLESARMIFVSSTDALAAGSDQRPANEDCLHPPKSDSVYVTTKRKAEQHLLSMHDAGQLDVVIVNPGLMFGPWDWKVSSGEMILAIAEGPYLAFAPGGGISVADVRGVAQGMSAAMQRGRSGQRYILAGENIRFLELWRRIARITGSWPPLRPLSTRMATLVGMSGDLMTRIIRREFHLNSAELRLSQCLNFYDSSRAATELNYDPGDLDTALRDAWHWLIDYGRTKKKSTSQLSKNQSP